MYACSKYEVLVKCSSNSRLKCLLEEHIFLLIKHSIFLIWYGLFINSVTVFMSCRHMKPFNFFFQLNWRAKKIPTNKISIFSQFFSCWIRIWKPFFSITCRVSEILRQRSKYQLDRLFIDSVYVDVNQQF